MMPRKIKVADVYSDPEESALRGTAVLALQIAMKAELLAVIMRDQNGVFVTLQPNHEREIASELYDVDWTSIFVAAMEH
jgi:hypothetical protein